MIDYSLLKNKIYLILLAYYNGSELPSFVELSGQAGISRQTASTKVKELLGKQIITLDNQDMLLVSNPMEIDIEDLRAYLEYTECFNPSELKEYLFGASNKTKKEQAKELGLSRASLYLPQHNVVYGIISEGKIKYVGTSSHYESRIQQHMKKRPYLTIANFIILAENVNSKNYFEVERELIHLLQPEWNIMSKE